MRKKSWKLAAVPRRIACWLVASGAILTATAPCVYAWGKSIHSAITKAALEALPEWQRSLLAAQREALIERYCMIPDNAQANQKELGKYILLPNGDRFSHLPYRGRQQNVYQIQHYLERSVDLIRSNDLEEGAKYLGCLLHFLEDSGSPAHVFPGDNQLGLMKDFLGAPDAFKDRGLHSLVEEGHANVNISGYRPKLLGATVEEAASNLVERYGEMVRHVRSQQIPILQAVFRNVPEDADRGRLVAATYDAQVAADAIYTILSIAKNRFEPAELAALDTRDVSSLTPLEMIHQSYFPQFSFYSDPYFGYPIRGGILEGGERKQPLLLNILEDGKTAERQFEHGIGLGSGCRLTYALPEKVYDRFECFVGLHAKLGIGGHVVFRVFANGEAVFQSGTMTAELPAQRVDLPLAGVKEISIVTESRGLPRSGKNYSVIAQPTLFRAKSKLKEQTY